MTAFDRAWNVVKMPIVPHSLKETKNKYPFAYYSALFDDTKTGERLPMEAVFEEGTGTRWDNHLDHLRAMILEGKDTDPRSQATFARAEGLKEKDPFFTPSDVETDYEHQGKGYATALYDMAASILNRRDEKLPLVPSDMQSAEAQFLWRNRDEWPVRDDL